MNTVDNTILELLKSDVTVVSSFYNTVKLPLINLDWNATSKPLSGVEQEMSNAVWKGYGNPHSCGTLTSQSSQNLLNEAGDTIMSSIFGRRNMMDYTIDFGGDGASYWLEKISTQLCVNADVSRCISFQRELHNSLTGPWLDNMAIILFKSFDWATKLFSMSGSCERTVILISLASHLTGTQFDVDRFNVMLETIPRRPIIIVDATCYLAHNRQIPSNLVFDFLVFSGHKFPGGPGSSGCVVYNSSYEKLFSGIRGTKNVMAISRLAISTRLRSNLMNAAERDSNLQARVNKVREVFKSSSLNNLKYIIHTWDERRTNNNDMVMCFSVGVKSNNKIIHPQIVSHVLLNLYGIQIRAGGQCSDTTISKVGLWDDLNDVDYLMCPIMEPSVCRISIPTYLLTEEITQRICDDFSDLLFSLESFMKFYIPTHEGWILHPEVVRFSKKTKYQNIHTTGLTGCSKCPKSKTRNIWVTDRDQNLEKQPRGMELYSKLTSIIGDIDHYPLSGTEYHDIINNPFRWFATYNDVYKTDI